VTLGLAKTPVLAVFDKMKVFSVFEKLKFDKLTVCQS
jgi:hypothetical protein